jgi:hypothetical protein
MNLRRAIATQWGAEVAVTRDDELVLVDVNVTRGLGRARLTPMQARELALALNEAAMLVELGLRSSSRNWNGPGCARTVPDSVSTVSSRGGGVRPPHK